MSQSHADNRNLSLHFHASMADIPANAWDAMVSGDTPHLSHTFLRLAESSGSVCEETGWLPCHLTVQDGKEILAAMPLYQKGHSWGEFVFDWSWADAYQRSGLEYYPKLVSASPFTPATASKLLVATGQSQSVMATALLQGATRFAREHQFSSMHLQFISDRDALAAQDATLVVREDCQFHWQNNDYRDFDEFLNAFSSKKRKNVKRERRRVLEAGITHRLVAGSDISAELMATAWRLCSYTFAMRGHSPYLNPEFFESLRREAPETLALVLAEYDGRTVAAAILLRGESTLYGRYWGSEDTFHSLHFETCYYQGIEYCIAEGIQRFEPGTQGEHKVSRGFLPASTRSAHWLAHPQFANAIGQYVDREAEGVERYMSEIRGRSPFKHVEDTGS
ncbi:MAG: GNAT family N-acetyltransferase [Pseudomonadota bacterium]